MKCDHKNIVCKNSDWGETRYCIKRKRDGHEVSGGIAKVGLWFCPDCQEHILKDWHTGELLDGWNEDII